MEDIEQSNRKTTSYSVSHDTKKKLDAYGRLKNLKKHEAAELAVNMLIDSLSKEERKVFEMLAK